MNAARSTRVNKLHSGHGDATTQGTLPRTPDKPINHPSPAFDPVLPFTTGNLELPIAQGRYRSCPYQDVVRPSCGSLRKAPPCCPRGPRVL